MDSCSIGKLKCSLFVGTEVIFTKSTMMKGLIVNSVTDESKEIIAKMVKIITNYINRRRKWRMLFLWRLSTSTS